MDRFKLELANKRGAIIHCIRFKSGEDTEVDKKLMQFSKHFGGRYHVIDVRQLSKD
ncbi:hypothetical protein [Stratiformator vulcanicus]|uniref:hypothetical protein n=1 Tax=Stratiformator vulcanicus TaxID=2527980 RepID=UPI002877280F|nr:hypothetical protein [Stratiformator vulcanicus]